MKKLPRKLIKSLQHQYKICYHDVRRCIDFKNLNWSIQEKRHIIWPLNQTSGNEIECYQGPHSFWSQHSTKGGEGQFTTRTTQIYNVFFWGQGMIVPTFIVHKQGAQYNNTLRSFCQRMVIITTLNLNFLGRGGHQGQADFICPKNYLRVQGLILCVCGELISQRVDQMKLFPLGVQ